MGKMKTAQRPWLAKNIIRRRSERSWSQALLAQKVGVHENIIGKIERGTGEGELQTRQAIADVLGCTLADLYENPDKKIPTPETIAQMTPAELETLVARASKRDGTINLEVERLKKEKAELAAKIQALPLKLLEAWDGSGLHQRAWAMFFLTLDESHLAGVKREFVERVLKLLKAHRLMPVKKK